MSDLQEGADKPLGTKIVRSSFWAVGARVGGRLIGFVSQIIVARLLFPEDFGLVILAFSIIGIVEVLSEFGFHNAVIYNQEAKRDYYDTAWTMSAIRGVLTALIVVGIAHPSSLIFDEPRLAEILPILSLKAVLVGISNIKLHDFAKNLWMSRLFIHMIVSRLFAACTTIGFALYLGNYWALVWGILIGELFRLTLSYALYPYLPRITLRHWRNIMSYSQWIMVSGALRYLRKQGHNYVLGGLGQVSSVGLFQMSYEIAYLASSELVAPMKRALFPGYAKVKHDGERFRAIFGNAVGVTALFAMPIAAGTGVIAHLAVPLLLGERWLDAIEVVQVLAIASAITSVQGHVGPVFLALGKTKVGAMLDVGLGTVYFCLLIPLTYVMGLQGAAITIVALAAISLVAEVAIMWRLIGFTVFDYLNACWRGIVACLLMVVAVLAVQDRMNSSDYDYSHLEALLISVAVGALSYASSIYLMWLAFSRREDSVEYNVLQFLRARMWRSPA